MGGAQTRKVDRGDPITVNLRPIATPMPLAFGGLVIASVVISGYELHWIPVAQQHSTGWVLVAVPIPLQFMAAWWGFIARSPAGATGSALLAAVWLAVALDLITTKPGPPGPSNAVGMLMFGATAMLCVPVAAELRAGSLLSAAVLATTVIRFALTGVSGFAHTSGWSHASGWMGIAVAATALYGALAYELEGTTQSPLLPTFRVRHAKVAASGPFEAQITRLENSAGVRSIL